MICVTGVYLRDITNMIFVILHLDVSRLSVCFSCWEGCPKCLFALNSDLTAEAAWWRVDWPEREADYLKH